MKYRFKEGDKVRLCAGDTPSMLLKEHDGEVVTIKDRCDFTLAYHLNELPHLWAENCLEEVRDHEI